MIVGIFAEGRGDLAVITNILKGTLNIDRSDIKPKLPEYDYDQTDLSVMPKEQHSSWTVVKTECQERKKIDAFFDNPIEQESFIVLHLDTAERHLEGYGVLEPVKNGSLNSEEYCSHLRSNAINKVDEWLANSHQGKIAYAIAIEETDAWVSTIYSNENTDTSSHLRPKERLNNELNRLLRENQKGILKAKAFEKYDWLSSDFRKKKKLLACAAKNASLKLFCQSLEAFKPVIEIPEST